MFDSTNHDIRAQVPPGFPGDITPPEAESPGAAFVEAYHALCREHGFSIVCHPVLHPEPNHPRGRLLFHGDGSLAVTYGASRIHT